MTDNNFLFQDHGSIVSLTSPFSAPITEALRPGVYRLKITEKGEIYLSWVRNNFIVPEKLFSNTGELTSMVITAYKERPGATAALFVGPKGGGKTMTTEIIANTLLEENIPTILVDGWIEPQVLRDTIPRIGPCVVLLDEFGKNFPASNNGGHWASQEPTTKTQSSLLPLFSNSGLKKVLFLITENTEHGINEYIKNRPDRVLFAFYFRTYGIKELKEIFTKTYKKDLSPAQEHFFTVLLETLKASGVQYGMDTIQLIASLIEQCDHDFVRYMERSAFYNVPQAMQINFTVVPFTDNPKEKKEPYLLESIDNGEVTFRYPNTEKIIKIQIHELETLYLKNIENFKPQNGFWKVARAARTNPEDNSTDYIYFSLCEGDQPMQGARSATGIVDVERYISQGHSFLKYNGDRESPSFPDEAKRRSFNLSYGEKDY